MARIIIIVVIGGLGYLFGPVLAAPPINFLATYLQAFGEWSLVLFAAIVIVVMRSYPAGLTGLVESPLRRWRGRAQGGRPGGAGSDEQQAPQAARAQPDPD